MEKEKLEAKRAILEARKAVTASEVKRLIQARLVQVAILVSHAHIPCA